MLTAEQRRDFDQRGVAKLAGAADPRVVETLRAEIHELIARRGLVPEPSLWSATLHASKLAGVGKAHGFAEVWGERVTSALDELIGAGKWLAPRYSGQVLSMPWPRADGKSWDVPHKGWHLDYRAPGLPHELPGVQLFLCLDRLESRSGATIVAAGLPRLVDGIRRRAGDSWPGSSQDVRKALRRESLWFRELCSIRPGEDRCARFMTPTAEGDGLSLEVVELTGEPGDVWLMHPWMMHAGSPNCGARPRLVMTERIRTAAGLAAFAPPEDRE
jgi:hypothetical protein